MASRKSNLWTKLFSAVILSLSLAACGGDGGADELLNSNQEGKGESSPSEEKIIVNEQGKIEKNYTLSYVISEIPFKTEDQGSTATIKIKMDSATPERVYTILACNMWDLEGGKPEAGFAEEINVVEKAGALPAPNGKGWSSEYTYLFDLTVRPDVKPLLGKFYPGCSLEVTSYKNRMDPNWGNPKTGEKADLTTADIQVSVSLK